MLAHLLGGHAIVIHLHNVISHVSSFDLNCSTTIGHVLARPLGVLAIISHVHNAIDLCNSFQIFMFPNNNPERNAVNKSWLT